ncbi:helix-hairpin-helix domain-containing protein [Streptomyces sp. NPDC048639]|uniref:helix-hairpin-helix domain-containing protein n=1 Tax=Streptomyces sp. NPDC048639 TaxID=3365581 RepID=UPI0037185983
MTTDRREDESARTPDRPADDQQDATADAAVPTGERTEPRPDTGADPVSGNEASDVSEASGASEAGGAPEGKGTADGSAAERPAAVDALAAAVRAVESGERAAASFFTEQSRPAGGGARPGRAPTSAASGPAASGPGATASGPGGPGGPAPAQVSGGLSGDTSGSPAAAAPLSAAGLPPAERLARSATVREVLNAGGAPDALADKVLDVLGERAAQVLREDPWQLLAVPGVRPEQADGFARALLGADCGPADERRGQALVQWLLERAALEGHTALEPSALTTALAQRSVPDPEDVLRTAIADGGVLVFQDALDTAGSAPAQAASDEEGEGQPVRVLVGLDRFALAEESLADGLARLVNTFAPEAGSASGAEEASDPSASGALSADAWQAAAGTAPSASAAELLRAVAGHGLVAHTGGEEARAEPAAVVAAARALGLRAYAAAHSENGRRRVQELLDAAPAAASTAGQDSADEGELEGTPGKAPGLAAVTVAGLLTGTEGPGRDADGALALDVLAVLDAPQLDVESAAMLVESLPDGARLILGGDPGVLWSAGPGRVFADVLAARACPQIASRTPDPGPIGELVSGIGIGELTQVEAPGKEVVIVPVRDAAEAVHRTVQLVADSVPRAIGVPPDRTQVITPGHGGAAGTRALNAALKERLNPGPGRFGGFDPGDRVAYSPTPGRTLPCTVVSADAQGLRLDCDGSPVLVERERVSETVRHGWALTAHQAAGMRWPAAVVVLPGDAVPSLTRSWVYTAFSRGERHLSVVQGAEGALPRAVAEVPVKERTTRLRALLRSSAPSAG